MKNWLGLVLLLTVVLPAGMSAAQTASLNVKGVIVNWKEVKARVPETAYLQLVKVEDQLKGTSDEEGLAAYDSEFPQVAVQADGSFQVNLKGLPEGKYFIALQRAVPREVGGTTVASGTPVLITKDGNPLLLEVPGTYPKDVGQVLVAVRTQGGTAGSGK